MDDYVFKEALEKHANRLLGQYEVLFELNADRDRLWELYLDTIPPQYNGIFRERREYDCSACRHFVKNAGLIAAIDNGKLISIWDVKSGDEDWDRVSEVLSAYVKGCGIGNVFVTDLEDAGTDHSFEILASGEVLRWDHWHVHFPEQFRTARGESVAARQGEVRSTMEVFERGLAELTMDSIDSVLELTAQGSLYRGEEHKAAVMLFRRWKKEYDELPDSLQKEFYIWEKAAKGKELPVLKIRNTAIGTLLVDISEGMRLDEAVGRYESVVAPTNYKRTKPVFTKEMLEDARKTITELGYLDSLARRFANADDITVNNILYRNSDTAKRMDGDIFDLMSREVKAPTQKFSRVEEIGIEDFITRVIPSAREIEAYVTNKHLPNFCSLIAPVYQHSKHMFRWDNNFSWAYSGNVADSILKQNVEKAGGNVHGVLRFSIQWNDLDGYDRNDLDAHCITPTQEIFFGRTRVNGGVLDVDIINPEKGKPAVENITWADSRNLDGEYQFYVRKFSDRGGRSGFRAEIEFDGHIYAYDCRDIFQKNKMVATVTVHNGAFSIKHHMPTSESDREQWGVKTNNFVPVSVICLSPNYWNEQKGIGNKHYMFMLKGCVNPELPNAWYNEFLNGDLYPAHKRVMEVMGMKAHVEDTDDQLSGLGFSSTVRNELIVRVTGASQRIMKIRF